MCVCCDLALLSLLLDAEQYTDGDAEEQERAATTIPIMTPMASFLVVLRVVLLVVSMALAATVGRLMLVVPPKSSTAVWKTVEMLLSEFAAHP